MVKARMRRTRMATTMRSSIIVKPICFALDLRIPLLLYCMNVSASREVSRDGTGFPDALKSVEPRIEQLYYKGAWDEQIFAKCVAIVGSRKMTVYGRQVLNQLIPAVIGQGYTTVSGFMHGVDIEVHRLTYLNSGRTIAVLGWGIDKDIDIENSDLYYNLIESSSLVLSEYEGKMPGMKHRYPERNRIVVGLSSDVIVVEAAPKSGSLITAHLALQQGKKLWAIPGPITSRVSEGTNSLIKEGLAEMLNPGDFNMYSEKDARNRGKMELSDVESMIVTQLKKKGPMSVNELVREVGLSVGEVGSIVMGLELKSVVKEKGGVVRVTR